MPEPEKGGARAAALHALGRWGGGALKPSAKPERLIREAFERYRLGARDRALAMELFLGVIRNLTNLDHILSFYIKETKKGVPPALMDVMRLAAYQLGYLDRIPAHAAVAEAVELAKGARGASAAGFVNAVLRSMLREPGRVTYPADPVAALAVRYSYPGWLAGRWAARFGVAEAEALMAAGNQPPPITLRANTLKTTRDDLIKLFTENGIECSPAHFAPDGIILGRALIENLPGYADGLFAVQDEAAQLVSLLLAPKPGDRILDACAAPGGKAAHIAALSGGRAHITAMDIGLDKLAVLEENVLRLGITGISLVRGNAALPPVKGPLDGVMLDAPCSALGVVRRRPEIKRRRSEEDVKRLSEMQGRMLAALAPLLGPGGALVYSVCSTEPDEGEAVVEGFLGGDKGFAPEDPRPFLPGPARGLVAEGRYLRTYPHRHGTDGFFAARIRRK